MMGDCYTCGGGRRTTNSSGIRVQARAAQFKSRAGKLPWVHVSTDGTTRTRYKSKEEADAAARLFGGKAQENDG